MVVAEPAQWLGLSKVLESSVTARHVRMTELIRANTLSICLSMVEGLG